VDGDAVWLQAFIQLFVAVDPPGVLSIYLAAIVDLDETRRRRLVVQSVLAAGIIGMAFFFAGQQVLRLLAISVADFQLAGGTLLVALSLQDLLTAEKPRRELGATAGIVPFAMPLIVGPAVMTTSIGLLHESGLWVTCGAFALNLVILGLCEWFGARLMGPRAFRILLAMSKVVAVLLAAMGMKMVREGLTTILTSMPK
jgi:multiple antibiotic resistance protein